MGMNLLPVTYLPSAPELEALIDRSGEPFVEDYFGREPGFIARFALFASPGELHFIFRSEASPFFDEHPPHSFVEGLWRMDVAELFLSWDAGYDELNLSPAGAWWHCSFSAPRVRSAAPSTPFIRTAACAQAQSWKAGLSLPLSDRQAAQLEQGDLRANVTAILTPRRVHFSWARLPQETLDFHQPAHFHPLALNRL